MIKRHWKNRPIGIGKSKEKQMELKNDWDNFLSYSEKDDHCNDLWDRYKNSNGVDVSYKDIETYEYNLYLQYSRDKNLSFLFE